MATLITLSGLPGVGKTTISRVVCEKIGAVHLRVDSVEVALKNSKHGLTSPEDAGYLTLAAIAKDNLEIGLDVVADTVNPIQLTRQLWAETASLANARLLNVEIVCSDKSEHRRRVETRVADITGHDLPGWKDVECQDYSPWSDQILKLDNAELAVSECARRIIEALQSTP